MFKKAYKISLEIHEASLNYPKHEQVSGLADQMRRASKGICANIAEGYGKQSISKAEFKRFIVMAIGSADEMRVWLRYCHDLGYLDQRQWQQWRNTCQDAIRFAQKLGLTPLLPICLQSSVLCPLNGRGAFCKPLKVD